MSCQYRSKYKSIVGFVVCYFITVVVSIAIKYKPILGLGVYSLHYYCCHHCDSCVTMGRDGSPSLIVIALSYLVTAFILKPFDLN
jgi:hypothetical protein